MARTEYAWGRTLGAEVREWMEAERGSNLRGKWSSTLAAHYNRSI